MTEHDINKTLAFLHVLLKIDNIEIMKCTIESFIEELEDIKNNKERNEVFEDD